MVLEDTPKLRSLTVIANSELSFTSMCPSDIPISWQQITSYYVSNNRLSDILLCLNAAPSLTTLVIDNYKYPDLEAFQETPEEELPTVPCSNLRDMTLITHSSPPELATYRALFKSLPGLTLSTFAFHIKYVWKDDLSTDLFKLGLELPPFLRFFSSSSQSLVSLSLQLIPIKQSNLRFVLGGLPQLKTLELLYDPFDAVRPMPETYVYSKMGADVVKALTERFSSPTNSTVMNLVPKLQHLTLQYMVLDPSLQDTEVFDMVRTRCAGLLQTADPSLSGPEQRNCLRSAHITIREHEFSGDAVEVYRVLKFAGLAISLQGKAGYV